MAEPVLTLPLSTPQDVIFARRRTREIAAMLELVPEEQTRLATAVSELARVASESGEAGTVRFGLVVDPGRRALVIDISGLALSAFSGDADGESIDLDALRAMVDRVEARDTGGFGAIRLARELAHDAWLPGLAELERALQRNSDPSLTEERRDEALDELRRQNQELLDALAKLRQREIELLTLNHELEESFTAVRVLHADLDDQARELRAAVATKSKLVSTISHEVRTPLYAVQGMTEAMRLPGADALTERQAEDVDLIEQSIAEALALVNDQLDLARLEAGAGAVSADPVDIDELFAKLRAMLSPLAPPAVELTFEPAAALPALVTDERKLSQILRNFINNALKFTPSGSVVVAAQRSDMGVEFTVTDSGPGLSEADQDRVFEEFYSGAEQAGGQRGTGLGLPLARDLATLLGGRVGVLSELGEGATFFVVIPAQAGSAIQ